jgi:GT2 family glycosyltransferase
MPRLAVVIVTWNRKEAVAGVLRALAAQTFSAERLDVVVVDNASTDGTSEALIARWRPEVVADNPSNAAHEPDFRLPAPTGGAGHFGSLSLVRNAHNLGGCGGFNTGFAFVERHLGRGEPDYVWLVDDDVDLPVDAAARLVEAAESDPSIGIVGSRAVDFNDRRTTIETTIYFDFKRGRMGDTPIPGHRLAESHAEWVAATGGTKGDRPFHGLREVDVASACSLLARWSAVKQVGFWDYRYFIYCDDADWCLRIARAGHKVVCNLDAVVFHTPWFQKLTPARLYYSQRNIVWLIQKVFPYWRLKYATFRWLASILNDCLQASWHRRLFHAEIIRRTAADIIANRGGRLDHEGPAKTGVCTAFDAVGALRPGATIAVMCHSARGQSAAADLRRRIDFYLEESGRTADRPRWIDIARNQVHPSEECPPDERIVYSPRLRSRLWRQLPLLRRPPDAVVIFDQTNDFPLLRGGRNVHIDLKWPDKAQVERDGIGPRVAFLARWVPTVLRSLWYVALLGPYQPPNRYG